MKKIILSVALATAMFAANAQDKNKSGMTIAPEAGDWSLGFDVVPVIGDFGNLFHTTAPGSLSQMPLTLVALHVMDANTAWRMRARIGFGSTTQDNMVPSDASTTFPPAQVTDEWKHSYMDITLGAGIQKSMGSGRVHGIYGAELAVNFGSMDDTYSYGNPFATNAAANNFLGETPTSTINFGRPFGSGVDTVANVGSRTTENKGGSTFGIGLNGFAGVEYFFAAKISLSAEYSWGLALNSTGAGTLTTEAWNPTLAVPAATTYSNSTGKSSSFSLDVKNAASIILHFYFQ